MNAVGAPRAYLNKNDPALTGFLTASLTDLARIVG